MIHFFLSVHAPATCGRGQEGDPKWNFWFRNSFTIFLGVSVTEISIETDTRNNAESDCGAELEICDIKGFCCKTSKLDNKPGDDRESGQTDVYTDETILGFCAKEVDKIRPFNKELIHSYPLLLSPLDLANF